MATLIPSMPLGDASSEYLKLFRLLKRLPDAAYVVWQRLAASAEPTPHFWILHQDRRSLLLRVLATTAAEVRAMAQPSLLELTPRTALPKQPQQSLAEIIPALARFVEQPGVAIPLALVFPNLSRTEMDELQLQLPMGFTASSKENLHPEKFQSWLEHNLGEPLNADAIAQLRKTFTPEVVIPPQFTVRSSIARNTNAQLTDYLLDYDQEWVLKTELTLNEEAETAAREFGLYLVNGVAGSGKSLILIYRAHLLRQLYPHKRILVLTHNRPLSHDLQWRYQRLRGERLNAEETEWRTFYGWCRAHWDRSKLWRDPIGQKERENLIVQAWHAHLRDTPVSAHMFAEEVDWYKDRLLFTRDEYLAANRAGRGFALNEALRQKVYDALEFYESALAKRNAVDWADVPRQLWQWSQTREIALPVYDIILVDEAQFFAPVWFELIKQVLKPGVGHLFLAADPTQGFLKRRQSWLASGLDVRGRATRLQKSYRTTREILSFATLLYRTRLPDDDDDIVAPNLLDLPNGLVPELIPLTSEQDEITRVVNEIRALVQAGIPPQHILVIHANYLGRDQIQQRLERVLGAGKAIDPKEGMRKDAIRVCTLNAATGLESPIVFLVGMRELHEQEQSLRLSEEERLELIRDNTRKLYMAITRAGQRLVMTYAGEVPEVFRQSSAIQ